MKRRASLFAASLKKLDNQKNPENHSENPPLLDKDFPMETIPKGAEKEKEHPKKCTPERMNYGIENEGKDSQKQIKHSTSLNEGSKSIRDLEQKKKNEVCLNSEVDVKMPEIGTESISSDRLSFSGVPSFSCENQTGVKERVSSVASEKEVIRNGDVNVEIEVRMVEDEEDRKEKKRKAEKDMNVDVKMPEVKKMRTGKMEEETRSLWEESINEM